MWVIIPPLTVEETNSEKKKKLFIQILHKLYESLLKFSPWLLLNSCPGLSCCVSKKNYCVSGHEEKDILREEKGWELQKQILQCFLGLTHFGIHFYSFKLADLIKHIVCSKSPPRDSHVWMQSTKMKNPNPMGCLGARQRSCYLKLLPMPFLSPHHS